MGALATVVPGLVVIFVLLVVAIVITSFLGLGLGIWAAVDASGRPDYAFERVGTSKQTWLLLLVLTLILFQPAAFVAAIVYLKRFRPRLAAAQLAFPPGVPASPPGASTPAVGTPAVPPGWYSDPAGKADYRYWDGARWTEHVSGPPAAS